nr:uncharacterized protein LOC109158743 [Ipomoea batatas]
METTKGLTSPIPPVTASPELSSQPENQITAGETAEEADLLRRSKKKTKRNLADRENDPMEMEEGEYDTTATTMGSPDEEENTDPRRNNARNSGGKNDSSKGKTGSNHGGSARNFNKEGFTNWNNSRENTKGRQMAQSAKEGSKSTGRNTKQANQAAETESHTVVRGYENGKRVETTRIDEEGSATETSHPQADTGDHHNDPPDPRGLTDTGEAEDPMVDVEFTGNQSLRGHEGESS